MIHSHMSQLQRPLESVVVDDAPTAIQPHHLFEHFADIAIASLYIPSDFLSRLVFFIYPQS
jgi:hypothetical protein